MVGNEIFIDLDKLRIGIFLGSEVKGGKRYVKYRPFNRIIGDVVIGDVSDSENALITYDRPGPALPGTWPVYKILLSGENGSSVFLEGFLNSKLPQLIGQMDRLRERDAMRQAALETRARQFGRGEQAVLQDIKTKQSILDTARRPDEEQLRRKKYRGGEFFEQ